MRLSLISAIATLGSVIMAQPVAREVTCPQVSEGLKALEKKAQELQAFVQSADVNSLTTTHPITTGQSPYKTITGGHVDISLEGAKMNAQLSGAKPFKAEECIAITDSFKGFSAANQLYFNLLSSKADVVLNKDKLLGPTVKISLKQVQGVYKTLSSNLIFRCLSKVKDLTSEAKNLDATLDLAIIKYGSVKKISVLNSL